MCIIAAKPANAPMPDAERIRNMWHSNPDGAGFMYARDGRVRIEKGFMTLDALTDRLDALGKELDLTKNALVLHFRITTHGGTKPENCHPFPVSDSIGVLQKLKTSARIGVAHNGIIDISPRTKGISDTMEYIASQMAPLSRFCPEFYHNKDAMLMIKNAIDSKMAIMDSAGNLYTIGAFNTYEGVEYSNYSYEDYYKGYRGGSFRCYGSWEDYDDTYYDSLAGASTKYHTSYTVPKELPKALPEAKADDADTDGEEEMIEYNGCYVAPQFLMCLDNIDGYVTTAANHIEDGADYYIDEDGDVYAYDVECDICFALEGYVAFDGGACHARFNNKYAEWMYCYCDDAESK
jgi:hypothetical protein